MDMNTKEKTGLLQRETQAGIHQSRLSRRRIMSVNWATGKLMSVSRRQCSEESSTDWLQPILLVAEAAADGSSLSSTSAAGQDLRHNTLLP